MHAVRGKLILPTLWLFLSLRLQSNGTGSTAKRILMHRTHMLFYNILTVPKLQHSDRGLYTCRVSSGKNSKQQRLFVSVYGDCPPPRSFVFLTMHVCAPPGGEMLQQLRNVCFLNSHANTSVAAVSDHPFIRLKPRHGSVIVAQAGQKSYRITPKLRAFPAPEVIWYEITAQPAASVSRLKLILGVPVFYNSNINSVFPPPV